jgi:hypothetical protein
MASFHTVRAAEALFESSRCRPNCGGVDTDAAAGAEPVEDSIRDAAVVAVATRAARNRGEAVERNAVGSSVGE